LKVIIEFLNNKNQTAFFSYVLWAVEISAFIVWYLLVGFVVAFKFVVFQVPF